LRSDRDAKQDITPVDPEAVLGSVARLPVTTWRYRTTPQARHVGPMAQDFAREFGLGSDDRVIASVDASGVALASIQALHTRFEALRVENERLKARLDELERRTARGVPEKP
jgi:hypothetical protein